jgi:hypothetical protein
MLHMAARCASKYAETATGTCPILRRNEEDMRLHSTRESVPGVRVVPAASALSPRPTRAIAPRCHPVAKLSFNRQLPQLQLPAQRSKQGLPPVAAFDDSHPVAAMLPPPALTFTIPSVHDSTPLNCRVYHPPSLAPSPRSPAWNRHAAIVAHPYAPLGGCCDDPIVEIVAGCLLRVGFVVGLFNFRCVIPCVRIAELLGWRICALGNATRLLTTTLAEAPPAPQAARPGPRNPSAPTMPRSSGSWPTTCTTSTRSPRSSLPPRHPIQQIPQRPTQSSSSPATPMAL